MSNQTNASGDVAETIGRNTLSGLLGGLPTADVTVSVCWWPAIAVNPALHEDQRGAERGRRCERPDDAIRW